MLAWAVVVAMVAAPKLLLAQGKGKGKGNQKKEAASQTEVQQPPPAAPQQVDCAVYEMGASAGQPAVDPALRPLQSKLKKPPFSSWKTFKLLRKHDKQAVKSKVLTLPLQTGSKLSLLYRDQSVAQGKKMRLRVTFTLDDKNDKRKLNSTLNMDSGDLLLIGNESDKLPDGATYIVAVSCRAPGGPPGPPP
ncbi:MAG TPA: hypothetical protein VFU21_08620 [Kofleriaceae bacterium]|nr:hypothetical protein [Kofleriaceae bacterium]